MTGSSSRWGSASALLTGSWRSCPLAGLLVAGAGSGLANGALARLAIDSVPHERASMGSAASNTARYIGASIAVAMVVAIASRSAAGNHAAQAAAVTHGATLAILASAVVALMGACLAALLGRARRSETQLAGAGS